MRPALGGQLCRVFALHALNWVHAWGGPTLQRGARIRGGCRVCRAMHPQQLATPGLPGLLAAPGMPPPIFRFSIARLARPQRSTTRCACARLESCRVAPCGALSPPTLLPACVRSVADVRPPEVLGQALELVKRRWTEGCEYKYGACAAAAASASASRACCCSCFVSDNLPGHKDLRRGQSHTPD